MVRQFGNLPIMTNAAKRPSVTTFFENWFGQTTVVNGIWTGSIAHEPAQYRMLTGTSAGSNPDIAVIAGHVHGANLPLGSIDLSSLSYPGQLAPSTGRVGNRSQLKTLIDPDTAFPAPEALGVQYPQYLPTTDDQAAAQAYLQGRADRFRVARAGSENERAFDNLEESWQRARFFADEADVVRDTLDLGTSLGYRRNLQLSVDLIEAGICHTTVVSTDLGWDTHRGSTAQYGHFETTFHELNELVTRLSSKGMLDNTLVMVLSEMSRTPKYNSKGGKDHWPHTSAMLVGGGLSGNRLFGATDGLLESRRLDLATGDLTDSGEFNRYNNFHAGILEILDVDPGQFLPGITPFRGLAS